MVKVQIRVRKESGELISLAEDNERMRLTRSNARQEDEEAQPVKVQIRVRQESGELVSLAEANAADHLSIHSQEDVIAAEDERRLSIAMKRYAETEIERRVEVIKERLEQQFEEKVIEEVERRLESLEERQQYPV